MNDEVDIERAAAEEAHGAPPLAKTAEGRQEPEEQAPRPLSHQLNLMAIRSWVDKGFAIMARQYGKPAPNGFAGYAAAEVWLHVQEIVKENGTSSPSGAEGRAPTEPLCGAASRGLTCTLPAGHRYAHSAEGRDDATNEFTWANDARQAPTEDFKAGVKPLPTELAVPTETPPPENTSEKDAT